MATPLSNSVSLLQVSSSNGTLTDEYINGLVQGSSWQFGSGPRVLTYSFNLNDALDVFGNVIPGPGGPWTASLVDAVNRALGEWAKVANLSFQNISSGVYSFESSADLAITLTGNDLQTALGAIGLGIFPDPVFANALRDAAGLTAAEYPNPTGDIFLDNFALNYYYLFAGGSGYEDILHEIGHALGLKHPGDDGGNGRPTFDQLGIASSDSARWTIMSSIDNAGSTVTGGNDASPMPLDILAIQQIYGPNMSYHTGNDVYSVTVGTFNPYSTIWDAGGIDSIDASTFPTFYGGVTIDLRPGIGFAMPTQGGGITAIAYNVDIENAVGTSTGDIIFGNALDNVIDGRRGPDTMAGRGGNDTYYVGDQGDSVNENAGEGIDTIISNIGSLALPANVENLTLSAFGAQGIGNALNNVLTTMAGEQTLCGGAGDDTYVISTAPASTFFAFSGDAGDYVSGGQSYYFDSAMGTFNVTASDSNADADTLVDTVYIYFNNFSNGGSSFWTLTFSTRFTGQPLLPGIFTSGTRYPFESTGHPGLDISGDGSGNNTLTGSFTVNAASFDYSGPTVKVLDFSISYEQHGEGATPALRGVLNINHPGPPVGIVELPNEGTDRVQSAVSFSLPANVENLTLTGLENTSGVGNEIDNNVIGNSGNNELTGGLGNDTLDGGAGLDTALYSGAASAYTITRNGATTTVSGPDGTDTLTGIERLQFENGLIRTLGAHLIDPNGDGKADLPFRDSDGTLVTWQMNGTQLLANTALGFLPGWGIVDAQGDFNGDGKSDVLFRNNGGTLDIWGMNGTLIASNTAYSQLGTAWSVVDAHGDYNGDGKSDILFRHTDGTLDIWGMNGTLIATNAAFSGLGPIWSVVDAHGDYNGDGNSDILLRHANGTLDILLMNGTSLLANTAYSGKGPSWSVVDANGDYNGDGKSDILFRDSDGTLGIWQMDGTQITANTVYSGLGTSWSAVDGHGDYNGDGKSDILLRFTDGTLDLWGMDGTQIATNAAFSGLGPVWSMVDGHGDYNGDGNSDILLRHSDGTVDILQMNGTQLTANTAFSGKGPSWTVATELGGAFTGDATANTLTGTAARDTFSGNGGNDTFTGNAGADQFLFTLLGAADAPTITDFKSGEDKLLLSEVLFTGPAQGLLAAANFVTEAGAVAHDGDDYILYDTTTGTVSYDADGSGTGVTPISFVTLANHPLLMAQDIQTGFL